VEVTCRNDLDQPVSKLTEKLVRPWIMWCPWHHYL